MSRISLLVVTAMLLAGISSLTAPATSTLACSPWSSRQTPPPTIRVWRAGLGRVDVVPFHDYVLTVMASGEAPTTMPQSTLEAFSLFIKQYAWYYTIHLRSLPGCAAVSDTTNDQLYAPQRAKPAARQIQALAVTWPITVLRSGDFRLTGYRYSGGGRGCGSDADGWHLFERSANACGRAGLSYRAIIARYYGGSRVSFMRGTTHISTPHPPRHHPTAPRPQYSPPATTVPGVTVTVPLILTSDLTGGLFGFGWPPLAGLDPACFGVPGNQLLPWISCGVPTSLAPAIVNSWPGYLPATPIAPNPRAL